MSKITEIFVNDRLALDFNPLIFLFQGIFTTFSVPNILSKLISSGHDYAKKIRTEVY